MSTEERAALRAPFPWFGGKSRAAPIVWQALGEVPNYVEPFAGSLAVLLARPPRVSRRTLVIETVNDLDCYLANFWRATKHASADVARWAYAPQNEADLHARHRWLVDQRAFRERMKTDPDFFDVKIAGWWVWGLCMWIGAGWCPIQDDDEDAESLSRKLPAFGNGGRGVSKSGLRSEPAPLTRKLLRLDGGSAGSGVHSPTLAPVLAGPKLSKQLPHMSNPGVGVHRSTIRNDVTGSRDEGVRRWMYALSVRLREVRVACGDWRRVLSPAVLRSSGGPEGSCGVFLDPPYEDGKMKYAAGSVGVSTLVREWAIEHAAESNMRIVLCGYEGEHDMPKGWRFVAWKAAGGYGTTDAAIENATRERLWLSPGCRPVAGEVAIG